MNPDEPLPPPDEYSPPAATAIPDAELRLWRRWHQTGDERVRDELARLHLPFARIMAAKLYAGRYHDEIEFNEYFQFAVLGLMEALDRFRPDRGAQFRTFAAPRIRGAILNGLPRLTERQRQVEVRKRLRAERIKSLVDPAAETGSDASEDAPDPASRHAEELFRMLADVGVGLALGILLEETGIIEAETGIGPERYFRAAELAQLRNRLRNTMQTLPERERTILQLHYEQEIPFIDIAARFGVTKGRIAQIHHRALDTLKASLTAAGLTARSF